MNTEKSDKSMIKSLQTIKLKNERVISYAEYGDPEGKPFFYFHGFPGSRLEPAMVDEKLRSLNARFIAIDRPGMGRADFQKKRSIVDCAEDVIELAGHLGLKKYGVIGNSGGSPYALACAYKIPSSTLTGCAVVSGSGPYSTTKEEMSWKNRVLLFFAGHLSWTIRFLLWMELGRNINDKNWWETNYKRLCAGLPEKDMQVMMDPLIKEAIMEKSVEAFQQGTKGLVHDFTLNSKSWGFNLDEIPAETKVMVFHGEMDRNVPVSMVKVVSGQIKNCEARIYPDEGHLSVFINKLEEIVLTS